MLERAIDANLNRLREGIRVIEDIARYALDDVHLAQNLKEIRHLARIDGDLLPSRDIKNDVLKSSHALEKERKTINDIVIANFKRAQESARVLEEMLKLDSALGNTEHFKTLRYRLYDIEIEYFDVLWNLK